MITGQDVRIWRQRTGVSIRQLARLLRVHFVTVFNWERGRYVISPTSQKGLLVLFFEVARRQSRRPHMDVCQQCGGTGLVPRTDDAQTPAGGRSWRLWCCMQNLPL
jgi:hypothetical protein